MFTLYELNVRCAVIFRPHPAHMTFSTVVFCCYKSRCFLGYRIFAQITWKTINNLIVPSNLNPKKNIFFPRENEKVMTKTVKQITNCTVQIEKNFLLVFIKRSSRRCCCLFAVFLFQASRYSLIWCESRLLTWTFSQSENEKSKSKSGKWWFYSLLWDCVRMAGN